MEGGTDTELTLDDEPGGSISGVGRTLDLVKDVLESVIGEIVQKCEDQNKNNRGKVVFSEEQRMRLELVFSESRYLNRESKLKLAAQLGMDVKQVEKWFHYRRRAEEKAVALRAKEARRIATTWPLYKMSNATKVQQEGCEVKDMKVGSSSSKGLVKELEENMKEVERNALDTVAIHPIPLLSRTLTQQEVTYFVHCPLVICFFRWCPVCTVFIRKVGTWDPKQHSCWRSPIR